LIGQKFGMSELKLSWPVTLTGDPPAVISRHDFFAFASEHEKSEIFSVSL
jgi:hypothetical protein